MKKIFFALIFLLAALQGHADGPMKLGCNSYSVFDTMFDDVCWSGIMPIRFAGATMFKGKAPVPQDATKKVVCACGGDVTKGQLPKIGFTVGMWMPSKIIDVARRPYCFPSLNGMTWNVSSIDLLNSGSNLGRGDRAEAFANWNLYGAPFIYMLHLLDDGACPPDGIMDFDLITFSELFPTHNDVIGQYTTFLNPEMALFANATALIAMPYDAVMSTLGNPVNELFWVMGAWGMTYPITGFDGTGNMVDPVRFTSLVAARGLALVHRLGMLRETIGDNALCERPIRLILRKDAFRWQMLAPSPENRGYDPSNPTTGSSQGGSGGMALKDAPVNPPLDVPPSSGTVRMVNPPTKGRTCNHPTGASTFGWGMWRDVPATGEDHSYMLFQWTDCCFGVTPGS